MSVSKSPLSGRRLLMEALRLVRRLARQAERRLRYKRLGWV